MSDRLVSASVVEHASPDSTHKSPPGSARHRTIYLIRLVLVCSLIAGLFAWMPAAHAEEGVHIVQRGESLGVIARNYNVSVSALARNNGIANPNIIHVGQRLVIPGSAADAARKVAVSSALPGGDGYYTVRRGNTLAQIARNQGMSVGDLMRLNGLTNPNFLWVGQQLRVSARVDAVQEEKKAKPSVAETIYIVQAEDSLETVAKEHGTTVYELMAANGLPNANFVWVGQRLRMKKPAAAPGLLAVNAPADGMRWIEVNLSNQTLTAWQGNVAVLHTNVSTGTARTPTVTGRFSVGMKLASQRMVGPGYDLPGVPWVMYFYSGYAIHGTYWHNNFGTPMSHGCVNMRIGEAQFLYNWAPPGTEVYVHY